MRYTHNAVSKHIFAILPVRERERKKDGEIKYKMIEREKEGERDQNI